MAPEKDLVKLATTTLLAVALIGCSSSSQQDVTPVTIEIGQVATSTDAFMFSGTTNVRFQVTVHNDTDQPVALHHIRFQTSGGGAYVIRGYDAPVKLQIGPKSSGTATVPVWVTSVGGNLFAHSPVTLRYTAYFDSPKGAFLRAGGATLEQE